MLEIPLQLVVPTQAVYRQIYACSHIYDPYFDSSSDVYDDEDFWTDLYSLTAVSVPCFVLFDQIYRSSCCACHDLNCETYSAWMIFLCFLSVSYAEILRPIRLVQS